MHNRREHPRYMIWFPVTLDAGTRAAQAICRDASQQGLRIASNTAIEVGASVTITVRVARDAPDKTVTGRIVRMRTDESPTSPFPHMLAIEFEEPVPELEPMLKRHSDPPPA